MTKRYMLPLLCVLLAACSQAPRDVLLAPGVPLALPSPAELGRRVEALQMVTALRDGEAQTFEGRLSAGPDEFRLVATDPMGRRAMSIRWTARGLEVERAAWVPPQIQPENILADLVLLYWPDAAIRLQGAALEPASDGRSIRKGADEVVRVRWEGDPWSGTARLENKAWGYALEVRSAVMP